MSISPFHVAVPSRTPVSLAHAPALSALNSLALLNRATQLPALDRWVIDTAAALSPEQRHANTLLLDLLGAALVSSGAWPDFPAYLADLADTPSETLRDRALRHLAGSSSSPAELLADAALFGAHLAAQPGDRAPDRELLAEAHDLLRAPEQLRAAAVAHLGAMWEQHLAAEWRRASKQLDSEVKGFLHHITSNADITLANLRAFAAAELVEAVTAQELPVRQITFVPSPHTGRHVSRLYHEGTLWLFFHAPRNFAVLGRQAPIGRNELRLRLEALADDTRLRILELFAERDELSAQEIQDRLELTQPTASRHLRGLAMFLVERRGEGASKRYQLSTAQFDMTFRALKQLLAGTPAEEPDARREAGDLRRFMDRRGRLTMFPTRPKDQLLVLEYLVEQFELNRSYTEREVNEVIARHLSYDDFVTIRRELYNRMFLGRERDGSRYWRVDPAERAQHYQQP